MSKSEGNDKTCIYLTDEPELIKQKIQKAKTDSQGKLTFTPDRPEVQNLMVVYAALKGIDVKVFEGYFEDDNMFSFKTKISDALIDHICPIG